MQSSPSPPPRAAAPPSRRGRARKAPAFPVAVFNYMALPWERDWAELPADAISCVFHKLDQVDLLLGGVAAACRSWRRAAREEPELWRRIDLRDLPQIVPFNWGSSLGNIMRAALRLSAGQCHTFFGRLLYDEHLLLLAEQAPLLQSLHLIACEYISNEGFANAIKRFQLLEELELSGCLRDAQLLELVAGVCPGLRHLRFVNELNFGPYDDRKVHAIARIHGLRSLHIVNDKIDNEGLTLILDNCRHLEYLNICDCDNINMDDKLQAKCTGIIVDNLEYLLKFDPDTGCSSPWSDLDDYDDLNLISYYVGDDVDEEEHESILDIKGMRRYLS